MQRSSFRSPIIHTALVGLLFLVAGPMSIAEETQASKAQLTQSLAEFLPPGALAYLEVRGLDEVIDRILESEYLDVVMNSPPYEKYRQSRQYEKMEAGRQLLETQLDTDVWTAGKKLLGRQIALGLYPNARSISKPDVLAVIQVGDADLLALVKQRAEAWLSISGAQFEKTRTSEGIDLVSIDEKVFLGTDGDWLAVASSEKLLSEAVGLWTKKQDESLAREEVFAATIRRIGIDHLVFGFLNTGEIIELISNELVPIKHDNALGALLFGGLIEFVVNSPVLGMTIDLQENGLKFELSLPGKTGDIGETFAGFFSEPEAQGVAALPRPTGFLGGVSLYRDFAAIYRQREQLVKGSQLPQFDKFETNLGNFLPRRNFSEDVLPLLGRQLTIVAARQRYEALPSEPGVKLPGFALVAELAEPELGADIFRLLFQTIVLVMNSQVAKQGGEPMVLAGDEHHGVHIFHGKFLALPAGERLPMLFNFTPAAAQVGDNFIMSSSLELCRDLIDELQGPAPRPEAEKRNLELEIDPSSLAEILEANSSILEARMIQQGRSAERAEREFSLFLRLLREFEVFRLSTNLHADDIRIALELQWK